MAKRLRNNYRPAQTSYSRVFLIENGARIDHTPRYASHLKMGGISKAFGDITKVEIPDPKNRDGFIEVDSIKGTTERVTTSLIGRYAASLLSDLIRIGNAGKTVDIQAHYGRCKQPSDFNTFDKILILEDAGITNYSTDDIGALESGERAPVNETVEISAKDFYEVAQLSFGTVADDIVTNEISDVIFADTPQYGCGEESDGYNKIFALTKAAGGSPSTPADVVYSIDGGVTWYACDVDGLDIAYNPEGIAKVGDYIVVISSEAGGIYIADYDDFDGSTDPSFTFVSTGFAALGAPKAIFSIGNVAYVVGDNGYIYLLEDPTAGVTVLESGETSSSLNDVYAANENLAVAVGDDGVIFYTTNGTNWTLLTTPPVGHGVSINTVYVIDEYHWIIGTQDGDLYYTLNSGKTWTEKSIAGITPTSVQCIRFATKSVGFVSVVVSGAGRIYRTYDGGNSWKVMPEDVGEIPTNQRLNKLAVTPWNVNIVVAGGLGSGTDGALILGQA